MYKQKIFTAILVVLGIYTTASAQTTGTTEFGITAGYNAATVATSQYTNSSYRSGFNVGVAADYYFSDRWSIKAKALYDQKGWNDGFIGYGNSMTAVTTNYHLNYITVPVMANWHFGRTRNWYLNFGPYLGILLNASETAGDTDLKNVFNTADVGLDVGIGIKFPISNTAKFFIEFNGQGGFTDIIKSNSNSAIRNSVSNFNIGFNF
jgi:outer membrane protein W